MTTPEMSSYYSFTENGKLKLNLCRFTENALVRVVQTLHVFNGISIYDGKSKNNEDISSSSQIFFMKHMS